MKQFLSSFLFRKNKADPVFQDEYYEKCYLRIKVIENLDLLHNYITEPYDYITEQNIHSFFNLIIGYKPENISFERAYLTILSEYETQIQLDNNSKGFDPNNLPSNGFDFEHWVANNLMKYGWHVEVTQGSSDQGLDVKAEKNGMRVGLQCKLYSSNVGNKAVQEIIAAKTYYNLDNVAVLSNAGYTKSAQDLALKSNVKLLSQHDIPNFDDIFGV